MNQRPSMFLALAWHNVFYNKSRTLLVMILIAVAFAAIALFRGYTRYASEGMKLGFIEKNGNFRIAPWGFWSRGEGDTFFEEETLRLLLSLLEDINAVSMVNPIIEFSGIIGNETQSHIFWAEAREYPNMGVSAGTPLFPGDAGLIIGEGLARKLGVSLIDAETAWVNLMAQSVEQGISLASFAVVGITDTGVPQQDEGLVIVSREAGLDFLGLGNTASVVEVRLEDEADQADCIASITEAMEQRHRRIEIKDWMDLNPSFAQIDALNQVQYTILTAILCVLVFTSLIQALSAAFKERLPEFGMLEAVGLRKGAIAFLLITEVVFMSLIALAIGLFASWGIAHLVSILNIKLYFPGYSTGYTLFFLFTPVDMALGAAFVFTACMLAMFGPLFPMLRFSVAHLMYHSV